MKNVKIAHLSLSALVAGTVALAPVADVQAASPLGMKLRRVMTLQPTEGGDAAAPTEGAPAEGAAAPAEGPAPAPAVAPAGPPPKKGLGMMITGAILTGAYALPLIGYGAYTIVLAKKADDLSGNTGVVQGLGNVAGGILITFGMIGLAVGAPLLGVGAVRFAKYQDWKRTQQVRVLPSAGRTVFGTITPGVEIRF